VTNSSIVIVGSLSDVHALAVYERLRERGIEPLVFDAQRYPEDLAVSLGEGLEDIVIDGHRVGRPSAVYVRGTYQHPGAYGVDADEAMREDWRRTLLAFRERGTLVSAILLRWEQLGAAFYNSTSSSGNVTKPFQIALLRQAELPVPETLWTNDPEAVRSFAARRELIYKPVAGGAATRRLGPDDLARLDKLGAAPVCFQELLPGDDIRVYVIDGRVICALRIVSHEIDFRQNEQSIEPIELPEEVANQCIRAAAVIGLRYTGMDLKADAQGRYKILELNPSAMFLGFEQRAKVDICGPLCDALAGATEARGRTG
jgi:glutathione synthase/RimK-type ligase-like ATP-grasp enzyme